MLSFCRIKTWKQWHLSPLQPFELKVFFLMLFDESASRGLIIRIHLEIHLEKNVQRCLLFSGVLLGKVTEDNPDRLKKN